MPESSMNTTKSAKLSTTRRLISAYGDQEAWKDDHDKAMECWKIQDGINAGIGLFGMLDQMMARIQSDTMVKDPLAFDAIWNEAMGAYRDLTEMAARILKRADALAADDYAVDKLEEFRAAVAEAECVIENSEFEGEIPPIEDLERMARPDNPRPHRYPS